MFRKYLGLAFSALILAGCVSGGTKVTESDISGFQKGVTTESQVIAKLGRPTATSVTDTGIRIDVYAYVHASPKAIDFVPIVGSIAGGANANSTTVTFTFNNAGILTAYSSSSSASDVRTGMGS